MVKNGSNLQAYVENVAYEEIFKKLSAHIDLDMDGLCDSHLDAWDAEVEYDLEDMRIKTVRNIASNDDVVSFELLVEADIGVTKTSHRSDYGFNTTKWYKLDCWVSFEGEECEITINDIELYNGGTRK